MRGFVQIEQRKAGCQRVAVNRVGVTVIAIILGLTRGRQVRQGAVIGQRAAVHADARTFAFGDNVRVINQGRGVAVFEGRRNGYRASAVTQTDAQCATAHQIDAERIGVHRYIVPGLDPRPCSDTRTYITIDDAGAYRSGERTLLG